MAKLEINKITESLTIVCCLSAVKFLNLLKKIQKWLKKQNTFNA